jgi:Cysteine protease
MRFNRTVILSSLSAAVLFAGAAAFTPAAAQGHHPTGLTLLRPDELAKIPPAFTPFGGGDMPSHVDLSPMLPPPGNQGQQSSCVAWATAYALRTYQAHVRERAPLVHSDGSLDSLRVFSPAFVYNQINNGRDAGSAFPDALDLLKLKGAAPLGLMPYSQNDYTSMPNATATNAASRYRIAFWRQINVNDTIDIKSQLNAGYPVVIGATIDEGFDRGGKGFVWNHIEGKQLGGHAMVIVGYDDDRGAYRVQNSWGRDWGDRGYYWLDYAFFGRVVNEAYVAKDDLAPITPPSPSPTPTPVTPTPVVPRPVTPPTADVFDHSSVSVVRVMENVVDPQSGPASASMESLRSLRARQVSCRLSCSFTTTRAAARRAITWKPRSSGIPSRKFGRLREPSRSRSRRKAGTRRGMRSSHTAPSS